MNVQTTDGVVTFYNIHLRVCLGFDLCLWSKKPNMLIHNTIYSILVLEIATANCVNYYVDIFISFCVGLFRVWAHLIIQLFSRVLIPVGKSGTISKVPDISEMCFSRYCCEVPGLLGQGCFGCLNVYFRLVQRTYFNLCSKVFYTTKPDHRTL